MEEGGAWSVDRRTVCALGAALGAGCAVLTAIQPPLSRRSAYLLEGVANFRQCGGYPTVDGRTVKWGRLFRAGSLEKASAADLEVIAKLGVATQLDMEGAAKQLFSPSEDTGTSRTFTKHPFEASAEEVTEEGLKLGSSSMLSICPAQLTHAPRRRTGGPKKLLTTQHMMGTFKKVALSGGDPKVLDEFSMPEFYLCTLYHAKKQLKAVRAAAVFRVCGC